MENLGKAFSILGLLTPFYTAGAVIGFFSWCEAHASDAAISAFSTWLGKKTYKAIDVRNALKHIFDLIYSSPLLSVKAFCRSAMISGVVWLLMTSYAAIHFIIANGAINRVAWDTFMLVNFPIIVQLILSDYCSLFVVNRALTSSRSKPVKTLVIAFISAWIVMIIFACMSLLIVEALAAIFGPGSADTTGLEHIPRILLYILPVILLSSYGMIPNLWLLLFVIGLLGFRLLSFAFDLAGHMQWFLKQGERHPLQALGAVGGTVTFVILSLGKVF